MTPFPDVKPRVAGEDSYEILDPPIETTEEIIDLEKELGFEFPDDCPNCAYDLRGSRASMVCPECGTYIPAIMKSLEACAVRRSETYADIGMLRWIIYGMIPITIWIPLAFAFYRSNNHLLIWLTLPTGLVLAIGAVMFATLKAGEESRADSVGMVILVGLALCCGNLGVFIITLMRVMQ